MAYVIAEPCVDTMNASCVEVCPVDCIHPLSDAPNYNLVKQLYIDPGECIDCNACVDVCPVDAIYAEGSLPEEWRHYAEINAEYFVQHAA
jgi:ferredoxin